MWAIDIYFKRDPNPATRLIQLCFIGSGKDILTLFFRSFLMGSYLVEEGLNGEI